MKRQLSPFIIILLSFIGLILTGTILLFLPFSTTVNESLKFIDAFFLSTSAVTITGMSTVNNLNMVLSPFGKIVMALLMKIGGLSVITISVFIMYLIGVKIGISNRFLLKESLNSPSVKGMVRLVKWIIIVSTVIELTGALINFTVFIQMFSFGRALSTSIIHSITAFNNAGFDLMGINTMLLTDAYRVVAINTMALTILGGLGFIVIFDLLHTMSYKKLSIHTKIVIKINLILWIGGATIFKVISGLSLFEASFLSVNARTAGFPMNLGTLPTHGFLILMILMFIGASPASNGGGLKTTTFYVIFKSIISFATGKATTTNKRLISEENKMRAFTLLTLMLVMVFSGVFVLLMSENISLQDAMHDAIAAISNSGFSTNHSYGYNGLSKVFTALLMFVGRVGLLTIISVFNVNWHKPVTTNISYVEEKIIIG